MLHFAFRQNTATIKNSWQSGWIITGALMHIRKSQRLVKKEKVDTLSRLCFTFCGCITYRLWASDMPRAVLFIYSSLPGMCDSTRTTSSPSKPSGSKEVRNTKLDDTYPLFPLSLLQPHCYLHTRLNPATRYSCPDWTPRSNSQL